MAYREPFNVTGKTPAATQPHSPWHSPVPYLFGGLAAMLGLIAFALLILACSYWKLSGYLEGNGESERDLEAGEAAKGSESQKAPPVYEEKILVIMAGQQKPTFIATPTTSSRSSSFNDSTSTCSCTCEKDEKAVEAEPDKQGSVNHGQFTQAQVENRQRETTETSESNQTQ